MRDPAPVSVVVPTIGRLASLEACLRSLAACDPPPAEVLIVDQSRAPDVHELAGRVAGLDARVIPCAERGISSIVPRTAAGTG